MIHAKPEGSLQVLYENLPYSFQGQGYITTGMMEPRAAIARALQPAHIVEFGALYGHALIACLWGHPQTKAISWCDNQSHTAQSNQAAAGNLHHAASALGLAEEPILTYCTDRIDALYFDPAPLVLIDSGHTWEDCLADAITALSLNPSVMLFDDWIATHPGVERTLRALTESGCLVWSSLRRIPTVNGIGVLCLDPWMEIVVHRAMFDAQVPLMAVNWGEHG